jgi:HSP20 family protein
MSIRWWGPGPEFMSTARAMDRLFDQFFGNESGRPEGGGTPTYALPVDILEAEDAYQLYATVAGLRQEDVDVTFEGGMLTISAKATPVHTQGHWIRQERPWGQFTRTLQMPKEVDPSGIEATVENGVLMVRVPKAAAAKPVRIEIGGGSTKGAKRLTG